MPIIILRVLNVTNKSNEIDKNKLHGDDTFRKTLIKKILDDYEIKLTIIGLVSTFTYVNFSDQIGESLVKCFLNVIAKMQKKGNFQN